MNTALPLFAIGLLFGGGIGFTLAAANGITLDGHDHSDPAHHAAHKPASAGAAGHDHHGDMLDLPAGAGAPTLALRAIKDPSAGWNLNIVTANFTFSPEHASGAHVAGEGHAHVYVDGVKLGRVYGDWIHLDNLPEGEVAVEVTLNANDHRMLSVAGKPLSERVTIRN